MEAATSIVCAKRYHHGDLRRALLDAADAVLERCGVNALSLRAVAREAGVSPAAPYHHFKDKDELLAAVAREGFERLKTAFVEADRLARPGDSKAAVFGMAYLEFALNHPALYRAMYDCARKASAFPDQPLDGDGGFLMIRQAIAEMSGPGVTETDVHLATVAAWCTAHGLAEMRGFAQFRELKEKLGGETAFLRGVLEHMGAFRRPEPDRP